MNSDSVHTRHWLSQAKELSDIALTCFRAGTLTVGALALLSYIGTLGRFPEDLSLAEGLVLYLLSAGVLASYGFLVVSALGFGCLLWAFPMHLLVRRERGRPHPMVQLISTDFSPLRHPLVWLAAGLAVIPCLHLANARAWGDFSLFVAAALSEGLLVTIILFVGRQVQLSASNLSLDLPGPRLEPVHQLRRVQGIMIATVIILPAMIWLGAKELRFSESAFRLAQLRKEAATVHVRAPWNARLVELGAHCDNSFLGPEYLRFDNIPVLLMSLGSKVILELPAAAGAGAVKRTLAIPKEFVAVE